MKLVQKAIMAMLLAGAWNSCAFAQLSYTYIWAPRQTDVGTFGSKDYEVLKALLMLCEVKNYSPNKAEGVDFIIRKNFLVSATTFRHAYSLYLNRILHLNPRWFREGVVQKGQIIILPSGPKFGASDLSDLVSNISNQEATFMALSGPSYKSKSPEHIKRLAVNTLRYYVSETGQGSVDQLFDAIKARGLIYAMGRSGPGKPSEFVSTVAASALLEPIVLKPKGTAGSAQLTVIQKNDGSRMLPTEMQVPTAQPRVCTSNNCANCRDSMKIPAGLDFSKVKILIVDTGIQSGLVDATHLIKLSPTDTGADVSPQFHGTFVYSEIAAAQPNTPPSQKLSGPIPPSSIYVSGAATKQGVVVSFNAPDIIAAWNNFNVMLAGSSSSAETRVVNLSVFGGEVLGSNSNPISFIPSKMLIVAAAGNSASGENAKLQAFARYSNGNVPILVVGALDTDGNPAPYSNYDSEYVQLFAPGDCVCGGPIQIDGTSQATPFVTVAAAALVSSHPDWSPMWVMWRLLSTADRPALLQNKAFAGTVNLARAFDSSIYLEEKTGAGIKPHLANAIVYDQAWKNAFTASGSNTHNNETLRLYPNGTTRSDGALCFTVLNFMSYTPRALCIQGDAKVQITETANNVTITTPIEANQINDLILPMPPLTGPEPNLPNVIVTK